MAKRLRALIVDDSDMVRKLIGDLLGELRCVEVVGGAADAEEGLKKVRELRPDVVTVDIRMPGESGVDLLAKIKQDAHPPVVVILTNYPFSSYRHRCEELGAEHFFDKTAELHKLVEVLRDRARRLNERKEATGKEAAE